MRAMTTMERRVAGAGHGHGESIAVDNSRWRRGRCRRSSTICCRSPSNASIMAEEAGEHAQVRQVEEEEDGGGDARGEVVESDIVD
jgi:hypothetical protein